MPLHDALDRLAATYHNSPDPADRAVTGGVGKAVVSTVTGATVSTATGSHVAGEAASRIVDANLDTNGERVQWVGSEARTVAEPIIVMATLPIFAAAELLKFGWKKLTS